MTSPNARRAATALALAAAAALAPVAARAVGSAPRPPAGPALKTDRGCYTRNQGIHISGSGYPPNTAQTISLNGRPLSSNPNSLKADAQGRIAGVLLAPPPFANPTSVRTYSLTTSSSPTGAPVTGRTSFQIVHTNVGVSPPFITPGKVTYTALGFTYGKNLYVHYLKGSRHVSTNSIGRLHSPCGRLSKKVRMFLFRPVKPATYTLVFDNSSRYVASYRPNFSFQAVVPVKYP